MKTKRIMSGILGLALVFGIAMALTTCGLMSAEIRVSNNSNYSSIDSVITVRLYESGRSDWSKTGNAYHGSSISFSVDSGNYTVRVIDGLDRSYYYPQDRSSIHMSGDVRLSFTGTEVRRTN